MLNSGKKFRATKKINILTLAMSEKKILNETKPPPLFKLNGRSLIDVIEDFCDIIDVIENFDTLCFTEIHLNINITDSDISLFGFEIPFRKDRNSHGGGIIMYYKSYMNATRCKDLEHDLVEIWFELKTRLSSILVNINYRSSENFQFTSGNILISPSKSGDKSLHSNYRPVYLLSCVSKLLEKIVFTTIFNHLHVNSLI